MCKNAQNAEIKIFAPLLLPLLLSSLLHGEASVKSMNLKEGHNKNTYKHKTGTIECYFKVKKALEALKHNPDDQTTIKKYTKFINKTYASLNALKPNGAIDNKPDNPPKMDHEPWILGLTKTLTVIETQLADEGYFSTREGWKRTLQGTG